MKYYDVYFEIYGKKMKAKVLANDKKDATEIISKKIIFHKIKESEDDFNKVMNFFNKI